MVKFKFKKGDRVRNTKDYSLIKEGQTGTVIENDDCPWVRWDNGEVYARNDDFLELTENDDNPIEIAYDIAQIIEQAYNRENSWDDSVVFNDSVDLPLDKFSFAYTDQYGRDLTHKLELNEGQYDLCDVIASFRLFLFGVGYDREDVDGIIDESRL